jgi:hypothetical protein
LHHAAAAFGGDAVAESALFFTVIQAWLDAAPQYTVTLGNTCADRRNSAPAQNIDNSTFTVPARSSGRGRRKA